uniref:Chitin-binding type-2 domain-containing protein n=1 Tax=Trichuris muris TaxID=70415 RepID=A0A5S6Q1D4_TRIMR
MSFPAALRRRSGFLKVHILILTILALASHAQHKKRQSNGEFIRGCYMVNWAQYRPYNGSYFAKDYESGLCSHVFLAFATISDKYEVMTREWNDIGAFYSVMRNFKQQDPNLKVLLSLGGWSFDTKKFRKISSSAEIRGIFVASLLRFLRAHGFDGFDLDWEYPENASERLGLVELCKNIAERFQWERKRGKHPELLFTAAVPASPDKVEKGYDVPALARCLDFVNVMTYDFHGSWELRTGVNSPFAVRHSHSPRDAALSTVGAAKLWFTKGMPKEKIVIGLPTYGRGWTLLDTADPSVGSEAIGASTALNYTRADGVIAFYECCELLKQGARSFRDKETGAAILVQGNQWFSYDDRESFKRKLQWIREERYGGAFVWSLDTDDFKGIFCPQFNGLKYPLVRTMDSMLRGEYEVEDNSSDFSKEPLYNCPDCSSVPARAAVSTAEPGEVVITEAAPVGVLPETFDCPYDGLFLNPHNENSFYNCSGGNALKMYCENGTSFSIKSGMCSQPSESTSSLHLTIKPSANASPNCTDDVYATSSIHAQNVSSTLASLLLPVYELSPAELESFSTEETKSYHEDTIAPNDFVATSEVEMTATYSFNSNEWITENDYELATQKPS